MAFQIWFLKSAKVVRCRFHVAPAKMREKSGFWQTKAYKSKTKINFTIFFDIPKGETFMDIM
jgi:hypothetical protein